VVVAVAVDEEVRTLHGCRPAARRCSVEVALWRCSAGAEVPSEDELSWGSMGRACATYKGKPRSSKGRVASVSISTDALTA
jgi:hypothetical protein